MTSGAFLRLGAVGLLIVAAACGGDDASESGSASTSESGSASTTAAATAPATDAGASPASDAPAPSGEPFVFGITSLDSGALTQPGFADGLEAWVEYANESGGIAGRPVEVLRCDSQSDAEQYTVCARQFIDDDRVLAVSGLGSGTGIVQIPVFEQAGLGLVTAAPLSQPEMTSDIALGLAGSYSTGFASLMTYIRDQGATSIAALGLDHPSAHADIELNQGRAGELGLDWQSSTFYPVDAPDMLPYVTAALEDDPEVLLAQTLPQHTAAVIEAIAVLGSDVQVLGGSAFTPPELLENPDAVDRYFFDADVAPAEPGDPIEAYLVDYFGDELTIPNRLGFVVGAAFGQLVEGAGGAEATRASVLEFLQNGELVDLPYMPEVVSRAKAPAGYPALGNPSTFVVTPDGKGGVTYVTDRIEPGAL